MSHSSFDLDRAFAAKTAAFLVLNLDGPHDDGHAAFMQHLSGLVDEHRGQILARGDNQRPICGDWTPGRLVLLRFANGAALDRFLLDARMRELQPIAADGPTVSMVAMDAQRAKPAIRLVSGGYSQA